MSTIKPVDLVGAIEPVIQPAPPRDTRVVVVRFDCMDHGLGEAEIAEDSRSGNAMLGKIAGRGGDIDVMHSPDSARCSMSSVFAGAISRIMASTPSEWCSSSCNPGAQRIPGLRSRFLRRGAGRLVHPRRHQEEGERHRDDDCAPGHNPREAH